MHSISFHERATELARLFASEKLIPEEVGYRWAKSFIQAAFHLSNHDWVRVRNTPCPHSDQLSTWVQDFILHHKPLSRSQHKRFFYDAEFMLNEATLDPRPETEGLIEYVVKQSKNVSSILDLGTGSGCIVLSLLQAYPKAHGVGIDVQARALEAAHANAHALGVHERVRWYQGHWYSPLSSCHYRSFDLIASNPPYIPTDEIANLAPEVRMWDPFIALDGGPCGLEPYYEIISKAHAWLAPKGMMILEIPDANAETLQSFGQQYFKNVQLLLDLHQKWRYLVLC